MGDKTEEQIILNAYTAFNTRNIPAALNLFTADVDWPNGMEGGTVYGHAAVKDYWTRQWGIIDPHVEPLHIDKISPHEYDVKVKQVVKDLEGNLISDEVIHHIYEFKNFLIVKMTIRKDDI